DQEQVAPPVGPVIGELGTGEEAVDEAGARRRTTNEQRRTLTARLRPLAAGRWLFVVGRSSLRRTILEEGSDLLRRRQDPCRVEVGAADERFIAAQRRWGELEGGELFQDEVVDGVAALGAGDRRGGAGAPVGHADGREGH